MKVIPILKKRILIQIIYSLSLSLLFIEAHAFQCTLNDISSNIPYSVSIVNGIPQIAATATISHRDEEASTHWANTFNINMTLRCVSQESTVVYVHNFMRRSISDLGTPAMDKVYNPPYDISTINSSIRPTFVGQNGNVWGGGHSMKIETIEPFTGKIKTINSYHQNDDTFVLGNKNKSVNILITSTMNNDFLSTPKEAKPPILRRRVESSYINFIPVVIWNIEVLPDPIERCSASIFTTKVDPGIVDFGSISKSEINRQGTKVTRPFVMSIHKQSTPDKQCNRDISPKISFKSGEILLDDNKAIKLKNGLALRIKDIKNNYINLNGDSFTESKVIPGDRKEAVIENHFTAELTKASAKDEIQNGPFETTVIYTVEYP